MNIIYTYGAGEALFNVFNAIAIIFNGGGTDGIFTQIMQLAFVIGSFWAMITVTLKLNPAQGFKWLAWFLLVSETLLIPTTSVLIEDRVTGYKRPVDNVPFGLAYFAGGVSQLGHILTTEMETAFSVPGDLQYNSTGFVFGSRLISNMYRLRISNVTFAQTMHNFVNQCVVLPSMIGKKYTIQDLRTSTNVWNLIKTNAPKSLMFVYRDPNVKGGLAEIVTCKEGAEKIEVALNKEIKAAGYRLMKVTMPDLVYSLVGNNPSFNQKGRSINQLTNDYLSTVFTEFSAISDTAELALKQQMVSNAILDATSINATSLGLNFAVSKAQLHRKNQIEATYQMIASSLPMFRGVFEAIIYLSLIHI